MAKALHIYEGGIHARQQVAVRADGAVFVRYQTRDPRYGYKWSAWRQTGETMGGNMLANPEPSRSAGFSTLWLKRDYIPNVRLPA